MAGLAIRTAANVTRVPLGFDVTRVASIPLDARALGLTLVSAQPFYARAYAAARETPGIESAALARIAPLSGGGRLSVGVRPGTDGSDERDRVGLSANVVGPGFFDVLGVRLVSGRDVRESDTQSTVPVAVISDAAARELWPGRDAVGEELALGSSQRVQIVGVVANARFRSPRQAPEPTIFFPAAQQPELGMSLLIRTRGDADAGLTTVLQRLRETEPRLSLRGATTLAELFDVRTRDDRIFAWVVTGLAATALALAALGVYAIVSFVVNRQRREVGVRIALGGTTASVVLRLMVGRHAIFIVAGLAAGIVASTLGTRVIRARLFEVPALDAVTYAAAIVIMTIVAVAAVWIPARRVSRLDPATVLRME